MTAVPEPTVTPVTMTRQEPDERMHVTGLKLTVPVPDVCEKVTGPVGDDPVIVAVQVVVPPVLIEYEVQVKEIMDEVFVIVKAVLPLLGALFWSPP